MVCICSHDSFSKNISFSHFKKTEIRNSSSLNMCARLWGTGNLFYISGTNSLIMYLSVVCLQHSASDPTRECGQHGYRYSRIINHFMTLLFRQTLNKFSSGCIHCIKPSLQFLYELFGNGLASRDLYQYYPRCKWPCVLIWLHVT